MSKSKYIGEFEFKASARMLYPYLDTPDGLEKWFADNVNFDPKRNLIFNWNGEEVFVKKVGHKTNQSVKYEIIAKNGKPLEDPGYIEFNIEENELTQTSFLQIIDYSDAEDKSDLDEVYGNLVLTLKEILGG